MLNNVNEVSTVFNNGAADYDAQRRMLIPCFDDFYNVAVSLATANTNAPNILDLGAGTGLFSSFILQKFPEAKITLIDLSENMLDVAKSRFNGIPNVDYIVDDYNNYMAEGKYDIIISALSIHHLPDSSKQTLYQNSYRNLKDQGIFINADQILGPTSSIDTLYKNDWKNKIEMSGLSQAQLDAAYERTKIDKFSTLHDQLEWLRECGFLDVDCVYKYYNFVVLFGRKSI